jgi:hypothetical protein
MTEVRMTMVRMTEVHMTEVRSVAGKAGVRVGAWALVRIASAMRSLVCGAQTRVDAILRDCQAGKD